MALSKGLLINVTSERVVRLVPPLIIGEEEISYFMQQFELLLKDFEKEVVNG
jgi:acetylornithine/N-succinyldiaminopimelate aminotransferase